MDDQTILPIRLVIDGRRLSGQRTGVGRYLEDLLEAWAESGPPLPRTLVVLADESGLARVPVCDGLEARVVGRRWPGLVWERFGLGRVLQSGDVLFAPTNLIPANWRGRTVLVMFDTLQEARPADFAWHARWRFGERYRRAAGFATRIIAPSESTARDIERYYSASRTKLRVIHPAPSPQFHPLSPESREVQDVRRQLRLGESDIVLFVGKQSRRRNVDAVRDAFRLIRETHPETKLVFAGPLARGAATPRMDDGIIEAGHVSEPMLRGLLSTATALVYPSEHEGFGLPIVEAMASGCPVITLANSALIEAGGDAAIYLPDAAPRSIALALDRLLSDDRERELRRTIGSAHAQQWTRAQFAACVADEIRDVAGAPQLQSSVARETPGFGDRAASLSR
jgi:glycosyltransferase involved in cell wall biosynthesis